MTLLWILLGLAAWLVVGCAVMAWWDAPQRMNGRLLEWVRSGPTFAWLVAVGGWPYFAWKLKAETVSEGER